MSELLNEALKAALLALIPVLTGLLISALNALKAWIEANVKNQWLLIIEREAVQVVLAVAQSTADPIKEAAADGKLSDEEKQRIKGAAMSALRERLVGIPKVLAEGLDKRLSDAIEAAVKQVNPPPPAGSK